MRLQSRKAAWALVLFALLFILASAFFPAFACHHDCAGDDCPVCMQIRTWATVLRLFGALASCAMLLLACRSLANCFVRTFSAFLSLRTPVTLKIKLLN